MKLHGGDLGKLKPPPTSSALCCQPSWVDTNCSLGPGLDSPLRFWPIARRSKTCGEQWWASFSQPRFTFPRMHCHTCPRCQSHSGDGLAQRHPPRKDMLLWCLHTYLCWKKIYQSLSSLYPVFRLNSTTKRFKIHLPDTFGTVTLHYLSEVNSFIFWKRRRVLLLEIQIFKYFIFFVFICEMPVLCCLYFYFMV